jgi:YD repeat-containing protein
LIKNILLPAALLLASIVHGQYYYNDIVGTAEVATRQKAYIANKVRIVTGAGFDDLRNIKTDEFSEWHEVKDNGRTLQIATRNQVEKKVMTYEGDAPKVTTRIETENVYVIYRFDAQGRVISLTDSSGTTRSVANYQYDAKGNLVAIINTTKDPASGFDDVEMHQWFYDAKNKPYRLFRIVNVKDTIDVGFKTDEQGNVIEEQVYKKGIPKDDPIYYYYDDLNRLSDIVRFNAGANRLLPDFMFEYDDANHVLQKTTTLSAMRYAKGRPSLRLSYLRWRYTYDEKGLKIRETLYGKDKTKIGHIEFDYSFLQ